jgi:hypothetical protein
LPWLLLAEICTHHIFRRTLASRQSASKDALIGIPGATRITGGGERGRIGTHTVGTVAVIATATTANESVGTDEGASSSVDVSQRSYPQEVP